VAARIGLEVLEDRKTLAPSEIRIAFLGISARILIQCFSNRGTRTNDSTRKVAYWYAKNLRIILFKN
jgi:hypothetical protein